MERSGNKYFGTTTKSLKTENFNISLTNHPANSEISKHAHAKPYLCLLASGIYQEKSHLTDIITHGDVVYRTPNYEHANSFSETGGLCLNIELNDHVQFMEQNELLLPNKETKQKGSIEVYKALFAFKGELPNDVLNIYCYETVVASINIFNGEGDINWVKKVKEQINDHPLAPISLNQLSIAHSLHPNYIVRKFKEVTGFKLSEYLTRMRLEYAIKNLIESDSNMTSIALDNGFYDQSHFNRNFKKHIETTPKVFRKVITG